MFNGYKDKKVNKMLKCTDLDDLKRRTKSNSDLIMQMISLFLEQTPSLINTMKESLKEKDWDSLRSAAHKMIPSFSIMGISDEFEKMTRQVQDYSGDIQHTERISGLVLQIENVCTQACDELEEEYNMLKTQNHEKRN
jgi:HPt (histidine-containing phosphotransfer) domain-containing protein